MALNTDFTAGQILTATQQNNFPRGLVTFTSRNTSYQPTPTVTDLFSLTFTAVADRFYRYTLTIPGIDASGSILLTMQLTDSANGVINAANQQLIGGGAQVGMTFTTVRQETAGTTIRKIRGLTTSGNAAMFGTSNIGFFTIEDIGSA